MAESKKKKKKKWAAERYTAAAAAGSRLLSDRQTESFTALHNKSKQQAPHWRSSWKIGRDIRTYLLPLSNKKRQTEDRENINSKNARAHLVTFLQQ